MKIAVLFGGSSEERHVSIASATQVVGALRLAGHSVRAVDTIHGPLTEREERELLISNVQPEPPSPDELRIRRAAEAAILSSGALENTDVAFIALHGGAGEDGTVQAILESMKIPYTGSSALGCAMAMNKDVSKRLFVASGIRTPAWLLGPVAADVVEEKLGFPVIVKPCSQGSTVGLTFVRSREELPAAYSVAAKFDQMFMVEKYISGRELTVGVLGDAALAVGEVLLGEAKVYDYRSKYQNGAEEVFPATLLDSISSGAKELALRAHRALNLSSYSRADFRLDKEGILWCLEVNALPGLTAMSSLPRSAIVSGISFAELCDRICELALTCNHKGGYFQDPAMS
ncbi:D-alanine--D-alanine ligase family protein [Burkholderia contaminans]|uniref:D-alanine--D-alanine ligase family protein n=1 Tax=Burkholderia contaminans TaxID=488447 RepID=UPI00158E2B36|nr:D-alanine--D-alanine ligase [Burkholderia contaminans]